MKTLDAVMTKYDVEIPAHLEADAEIAIISGKPQRQGDVMVRRMTPGLIAGLEAVPAAGIPVVRGESGHTHTLVAEGNVTYAPSPTEGLIQGSLEVKEGGQAFLIHPEHGAMGIGVGQYTIRRQREQADEIRAVED